MASAPLHMSTILPLGSLKMQLMRLRVEVNSHTLRS